MIEAQNPSNHSTHHRVLQTPDEEFRSIQGLGSRVAPRACGFGRDYARDASRLISASAISSVDAVPPRSRVRTWSS